MESLSVGTNPKFLEIIEESRKRYEREGGISIDEVRRRLGIPRTKERKRVAPR